MRERGGRLRLLAWVAVFAFAPSPLSAGQEPVEIAFRGESRPQWEVVPEKSSVAVARGEVFESSVRVTNRSGREVVARVLTEVFPPAGGQHLVHLACGPVFTVILRSGETAAVPSSYVVSEGTPKGIARFQVTYAVYSFEALVSDPLALGREIYTMRCVSCHGTLGRGDGPVGRLLTPRVGDLTPALRSKGERDLLVAIRAGVGAMPAFSPALSDPEQRAVLLYLRNLPGAGGAGSAR